MNPKHGEPEAAQAAVWYARLRAEDCALEERRAFAAWIGQDPANRRAYERVRSLSRQVSQLAQIDPRVTALAEGCCTGARSSSETSRCDARRPAAQWRRAAAVLLGVGVAAMLMLQQPGSGGRGTTAGHYSNAGNRQQVIALADGSRVHLDVGAELEVRLEESQRRLVLRAGRAFFHVAHDASRPFSVSAGSTRTVALGTRFEVVVAERSVSVTLDEGSVEISSTAEDSWKEVLQPGEQLQFDAASGDRQRHEVDAPAVGSWMSGRLVFRSTPLADALAEINRYSDVKLRIGDDSLGRIPIGGTFEAGADSAIVAAALAAALPLDAVQVGAKEIALFRRYETAD